MDHIDRKLLDLLSENARMPLKQLASEVFLSSPAVAGRVEKLEKQGYITSYSAGINEDALGYHITAFISLDMPPTQKPKFYPFIQSCPNVVECNCVTGQYSMLIKVKFPNTQELDQFIGELQKFGSTQTQIVFSTSVMPRNVRLCRAEDELAVKQKALQKEEE